MQHNFNRRILWIKKEKFCPYESSWSVLICWGGGGGGGGGGEGGLTSLVVVEIDLIGWGWEVNQPG